MSVPALKLTAYEKADGPLTKTIQLDASGAVRSDASCCFMARGFARRLPLADVGALADELDHFKPQNAISLGDLRPDLPDAVEITTKAHLNGVTRPDLIARTADNIIYRPGEAALALFDFDTKGMVPEVAERIRALGGFEPALTTVLPGLATAARLLRASTSAGLYRRDTGERLPGSDSMHLFAAVQDGTDIDRFLKTLHARCWLAGLGWLTVGTGGQLLERSIVDRVVGLPERLVFEGPPVLMPPLAQDAEARRPIAIDGAALATLSACPPLTLFEQAKYKELRAKLANALHPEIAKARTAFVDRQAERLAKRTGISAAAARRTVERQCHGVLLPDVTLEFDDADLAGTTVATVLEDPDRFVGETLADPLEGVGYGRGKAKVMRRADGSVWIHSFAHGRTVYELKFDFRAVEAELEKAADDDLAATFIRFALAGDFDASEIERLRNLVHTRTGIGKRPLDAMLKEARQGRAEEEAREAREQQLAERQDPRPQFDAPAPDAEWLPVLETLTEALRKSPWPEPPARDPDGYMVQIWVRKVIRLRALTAAGANSEPEATPLPVPDQPLITHLEEPALAELIERHAEFVLRTRDGVRPVHLETAFVRHMIQRQDDGLPVVTAVATLPVVLDDGALLAENGLAREHGTVFRIPEALLWMLPRPSDCTPDAVADAMWFLIEEWLVDVTASYPGRCVLVACALTIIERVLLGERPAFFVTAGRRGGGKTTVLTMIALAVLGVRAAAAAWSPNEEERRKALFSYLLEGVPFLVWDNIEKGALVSCPHIEKALTAETYSDRLLGASRSAAPFASAVQAFTGNNIGPKGDLASRSLIVRLPVTRPDPENRDFTHPDPFGWTLTNRGKILTALYTILLGNPRRKQQAKDRTSPPTRFKSWWELVGSAVEHAAQHHQRIAKETTDWLIAAPPSCPPEPISFRDLFLGGEAEDEQANALVEVLTRLRGTWPNGEKFEAREVMSLATEDPKFRAALEQASGKAIKEPSPTILAWRLKALRDAPVLISNPAGQQVVALRYSPMTAQKNDPARFWVEPV